MNRAVLQKGLRDALLLLALTAVGILVFELVLARMLVEFARDVEMLRAWLERPLIKTLIRLILGDDIGADVSATTLAAFGLVHPVLISISWALLITLTSGAISAETGGGTADMLLSLPVSRVAVYVSRSLVWLLAAVLVTVMAWVGLRMGTAIFPLPSPIDYAQLRPVLVGLLMYHVCLGSVAMLASAVFTRRSFAVGTVVGYVVFADFLNLAAQFVKPLWWMSYISVSSYYRPLLIVREGGIAASDFAVLGGAAVLAWGFGLWRFARRDIPAA
jgi:ABC-2 type transport system permease protein